MPFRVSVKAVVQKNHCRNGREFRKMVPLWQYRVENAYICKYHT